jgi:hypothetical protein
LDLPQFWAIIESGGPEAFEERDQQLAAVREQLGKLPPDELTSFLRLFNQLMDNAYRWDLWGAAYLINGGSSDDGFAYFRSWLISRGRTVYEASLQNPDNLEGLVDPDRDDYEFEDLWGLPQRVYEEQTGEEMPPVEYRGPHMPRGPRWDFDNDEETSRRLPKLATLYL